MPERRSPTVSDIAEAAKNGKTEEADRLQQQLLDGVESETLKSFAEALILRARVTQGEGHLLSTLEHLAAEKSQNLLVQQ